VTFLLPYVEPIELTDVTARSGTGEGGGGRVVISARQLPSRTEKEREMKRAYMHEAAEATACQQTQEEDV
jgi:hypothetical protein